MSHIARLQQLLEENARLTAELAVFQERFAGYAASRRKYRQKNPDKVKQWAAAARERAAAAPAPETPAHEV